MRKILKTSLVMLCAVAFSILAAALCVSAEEYPIYVGSTQVTSSNASDVLGDGTVTFDAATSTLTFTNANVSDGYSFEEDGIIKTAALYIDQDITVFFYGISTLEDTTEGVAESYGIYAKNVSLNLVPDSSDDKDNGRSSAELHVYGADADVTYGICANYIMYSTIADTTATAGAATDTSYGLYVNEAHLADGNLTVNAGDVTSDSDALSVGAYFGADTLLRMKHKFYPTSGNATGSGVVKSVGIMYDGNLNFRAIAGTTVVVGNAVATGSGSEAYSIGITSESCDLTACGRHTIDVTAGNAEGAISASIGVYLPNNAINLVDDESNDIIEDARVNVVSQNASTYSVAVYADEINALAGRISAAAECETECTTVVSVVTNNVPEGVTARNPKNGERLTYDAEKQSFVGKAGVTLEEIEIYDTLLIVDNDVVYVAGIQVTQENKNNVLGDGKVRYDFDENILYLNNAEISGSYLYNTVTSTDGTKNYSAAIYFEQDLTIVVSGTNVVRSVYSDSTEMYKNSGIATDEMNETKDTCLIIRGSSTDDVLNVYAADATESSNGIYVGGNLYTDSVTVNAYGAVAAKSFGIDVDLFSNSAIYDRKDGVMYAFVLAWRLCGGDMSFSNSVINANGADIEDVAAAESTGISSYLVRVTDGTVLSAKGGNISSQDTSTSSGMIIGNELSVNGGSTLNAIGGDVTVQGVDDSTSASSIGLNIFLGGVEVDEESKLYCNGGATTVLENGGSSSSMGAAALGGFYLDGNSYVEANADAADVSYGLFAGVLLMYDGEISASCDNNGTDSRGAFVYTECTDCTLYNSNTKEVLTFVPEQGYVDSTGSFPANVTVISGTFESIPVFVGGVQVTFSNYEDVLGDGKVSYDIDSNTLTLNNADISGNFVVEEGVTAGIYTSIPLNIRLVGTNTVKTNSTGSAVEAGVAYFGQANEDGSAVIKVYGDSTEDTLTVTTSDTLVYNIGFVTTGGGFEFKNATVNCNVGATGEIALGIYGGFSSNMPGNIIVDGAIINITSGDVVTESGTSGASMGAVAYELIISNNGKFNAVSGEVTSDTPSGSIGVQAVTVAVIDGGEFNVTGGDVTINNTEASEDYSGSIGAEIMSVLYVDGASTVVAKGGNLNVSAPGTDDVSVGVLVYETLTVKADSSVIGIAGETASTSLGVHSASIVVESGEVEGASSAQNAQATVGISCDAEVENVIAYDKVTGETLSYGDGTYVNSESAVSKNAVIATEKAYDLWVGGVQVTNVNMFDILGDGKVSYNPDTNVLTLDNAVISGVYAFDEYSNGQTSERYDVSAGIYSAMSINIRLIGENTINAESTESFELSGIYSEFHGSSEDVTVNIYGDGENASLTVNVSDAVRRTIGIYGKYGSVAFADASVNVLVGDASHESVAIYFDEGGMLVDNCNLVVRSGNVSNEVETANYTYGVYCETDITVKNSSNVDIKTGDAKAGHGVGIFGLYTKGTLTLTGDSHVAAKCGTAYPMTMGVFSIGVTVENIVISENSTLEGVGGDGTFIPGQVSVTCGVNVGTLTFTDMTGSVSASTLSSNSDASCVAVMCQSEIENSTVRQTGIGTLYYSSDSYTYVDGNGKAATNVTIVPGTVLIGDYNIAVNGIPVTAENAADILGDLDEGATAYYDEATNVLTLENAVIDTYLNIDGTYAAIIGIGNLNINLVGNNKVVAADLGENCYSVIGVGALGNITITSEEAATLDVETGFAMYESYGILTITDSEDSSSDLVVSGKAIVTSTSGDLSYMEDYATSCGVMSYGSIEVLDNATLKAYGGSAVRDASSEITGESGMSVGVMAWKNLTVNTTGRVYGFGKAADYMCGGAGALGVTAVEKGSLAGEYGTALETSGTYVSVLTSADLENCYAKSGPSDSELYDATWVLFDENYGGVYVYGETPSAGVYTIVVPKKGISGLEVKKSTGDGGEDEGGDNGETGDSGETGDNTEGGTDDDEDVISVIVTGYDDNIVAFASYDVNGKMIDFAATSGAMADDEFEIHPDIDLTDAVLVKAFVFESVSSAKPICENLETVVFADAE